MKKEFAQPIIHRPVDDSLVLWFAGRGSRRKGTVLADLSKKGNNGIIDGVTWKNTPLGHSVLSFDGNNDYINVGNKSSLNPGSTNFSLSFWINLVDNAALQVLVAKYDGSSYANNIGGQGYEVLYRGDFGSKSLYFRINNGLGTGTATSSDDDAGYSNIAGGWHCIVCVADRIADKGYIYVDGVNVVDGGFDDISPQSGDLSNNGNFTIGRQTGDGFSSFMEGKIDDVRVYKKELTSNEVMKMYQETKHFYGK